ECQVPFDQRQGAFADRTEADHHDGAVEAGEQVRLLHWCLLRWDGELDQAARFISARRWPPSAAIRVAEPTRLGSAVLMVPITPRVPASAPDLSSSARSRSGS